MNISLTRIHHPHSLHKKFHNGLVKDEMRCGEMHPVRAGVCASIPLVPVEASITASPRAI